MSAKRTSLILALIITISLGFTKLYHLPKSVLGYDTLGYYMYFPALQLHNDLALKDISWLDEANKRDELTPWYYQFYKNPDTDTWIIKYTPGWLVMHYPFVVGGHLYAKIFDYPDDGFSRPYQAGLLIGSYFYIFLGFYFLLRSLQELFSRKTAIVTTLLLLVGTNVAHLFAIGPLIIHTIIFSLNALLLWLVVKHREQPISFKTRFAGGLVVGLITLSRPTEVFSGIFLLAFWLSWPLKFNKKLVTDLLPIAVGFLIPLLPLFAYWKFVSGSFFINSYGNNAGEGLDIFSPYILEFLFSARKGWFIFTPLVMLIIPGYWVLYRKHKAWFWPCLFYGVIMLWLTASWTNWWYATASYSARGIVPALVFLVIPFAALLEKIANGGLVKRTLNYGLIAFLVLINLYSAWMFEHFILTGERNSWPYLKQVLFKKTVTEEDLKLLALDRANERWDMVPNKGDYTWLPYAYFDFEENSNTDTAGFCGRGGKLNPEVAFTTSADIPFIGITTKDHAYLMMRGFVKVSDTTNLENTEINAVIHLTHNGETYGYFAKRLELKKELGWQRFEVSNLSPVIRDAYHDKVKAYLWEPKGVEVYLDNVQIGAYTPNFSHLP